jgi:hypothetical protein
MMNNILFLSIIFTMVAVLIYSPVVGPGFSAKAKTSWGPLTCDNLSMGGARCCQTETGSDGIEITYCTLCKNQNPPSDCSPRYQDTDVRNPSGPNEVREPNNGDGVLEQPTTNPSTGNDISNPTTGGILDSQTSNNNDDRSSLNNDEGISSSEE